MTRTFAFLSGIPALVYQVVWTREVGLLAGSQIEAISVVLAVFFGGLALGARVLGGVVDRANSALRCYGVFETAAGMLAAATIPLLRWLGRNVQPDDFGTLLLYAGALLLPVTFLLGGTLPALLRATVHDLRRAAEHAGALNGANTAGSVLGVAFAVVLIPTQGLLFTAIAAGAMSLGLGGVALGLARNRERPHLAVEPVPSEALRWPILLAAGLAGVATLAFEVLAGRMATLQLGSSLYAWSAVLGLVLVGLALGNLATSKRAARTVTPRFDLGLVEIAAGVTLAAGLFLFAPAPTVPSEGLTPRVLLTVAAGVLPAAFAMGSAFPFFVRLAGQRPELGASFGAVCAANTAGGISGALLAPFALLPGLGLVDGALFCAGINAALGLGFLASSTVGQRRVGVLGVALCCVLAAFALGRSTFVDRPAQPRLIFVEHGAQATVAVLQYGDRRDLIVDGDPEASTFSAARGTEEFLAVLPLLLHPDPRALLEVGLGSGITLGTAAQFPLERIECVEIADGVLGAARFFAPENGAVSRGDDPRLTIIHADGRAHLLQRPRSFDVVIANTVHPWSVGATGLYSREFFGRLAGALRSGGIAVQWLPLGALGAENLAAVLRGFFDTFAYGGLWWGEGNAIVVGSNGPLPGASEARFEALKPSLGATLKRLSIETAQDLRERKVAKADEIRRFLGSGEMLSDDRPVLERPTAGTRRAASISEYVLLEGIAGASRMPGAGAALLDRRTNGARPRRRTGGPRPGNRS